MHVYSEAERGKNYNLIFHRQKPIAWKNENISMKLYNLETLTGPGVNSRLCVSSFAGKYGAYPLHMMSKRQHSTVVEKHLRGEQIWILVLAPPSISCDTTDKFLNHFKVQFPRL